MLNLLLDNIAEKFPLKAALIFEDKTYTYADLLSRTRNLAAPLLERCRRMWFSKRVALQLGKNNWSILPECAWLDIKFRTRLFSPRTYRTDPPERLTEKLCGRTPLGKLSRNQTIRATYLTIIRASHALFTRFSRCPTASIDMQKPSRTEQTSH